MSALARAVSRSLAPAEAPTNIPTPQPAAAAQASSELVAPLVPQTVQPNPLLLHQIDLVNLDRADRQIKQLLRMGASGAAGGSANANAAASMNGGVSRSAALPASSILGGSSRPTVGSQNNTINQNVPPNQTVAPPNSTPMAASPTTRVPPSVLNDAQPTHSASPDVVPSSSTIAPGTAASPPMGTAEVKVLGPAEREALLAAWDRYSRPIRLMHSALKTPLKALTDGYEDVTTHAPLSAARKAELLSELCTAAEKIALSSSITLHAGVTPTSSRSVSPGLGSTTNSMTSMGAAGTSTASASSASTVTVPMPFPVKDVDAAVAVVLDALDSPSLVIRLLGLHGAKFLCYDRGFYDKFLKNRGFYLVASAIDGEHPQESDYALTLIHSITRLKLKGALVEHLPYYIIARVVSCLDPLDQRAQSTAAGTTPPPQGAPTAAGVTFSLKSRCLDILQLMLKVYPEEMSEADAIRPMLLTCLIPSTPKEEMERIIVALLEAFDDPLRRRFIRDSDIGVIFSPFTDHSFREGTMITQQNNQQSTINASLGLATGASGVGTVTGRAREVICKFLGSWSGMLWLSTETAGIRSLIDALHLPGRVDLKLSLISLFNQSLRRMAPHRGIPAQGPWEGTSARLRKGTVMGVGDEYELIDFEDGSTYSDNHYNEYLTGVNEGVVGSLGLGAGEGGGDDYAPITSAVGYHACDVFLGCLLLVLNHHGLPDALIAVMRNVAQRDESSSSGTSSGDGLDQAGITADVHGANPRMKQNMMGEPDAQQPVSLLREAALLLQHIIVLMDTLLPRATASKLHGSLNEAISSMAADGKSFAGGLTNTIFHNLGNGGETSIYSSGVIGFGTAKGLGGSGGSPTMLMSGDIEHTESYFVQLLRESQVIENSSASVGEASRNWNPTVILTLIEGPLRNPLRLRYAREKTSLIQRLLLFFRLSGPANAHSASIPPASSVSPNSTPAFGRPHQGTSVASHIDPYGTTSIHFGQITTRHHTTITNGEGRFKWTAIGVALMDLLLSSREGVEALTRADFMLGYVGLFEDVLNYYQQQLRRGGGAAHTRLSSLLTRESFQEGTGIDVLKIMARFTLSANGLNLLKKYAIFDRILNIFVLAATPNAASPSRTAGGASSGAVTPVPSLTLGSSAAMGYGSQSADLCNLCSKILQYSYVGSVPNFGVCEEFRRMMQIALGPTVEDSGLKNAAIDQLARVIWRDLGGSLSWGIERLLALLDDGNKAIVTRAYKLLSNICFSSAQALDNLIARAPRALLENKQLVDQRRMLNINALLYRMVGHPQGFAFLTSMGWVSKELDHWANQGALMFVDDLQQVIARAGSDANMNGQPHQGAHAAPTRHYRTASNAPNYRQAVTTVTTSRQVAHSIYPDHVARDLCRHKGGCEVFGKSQLWLKSIQTVMTGASETTTPVWERQKRRNERRQRRKADAMAGIVGNSSTESSDSDSTEDEEMARKVAAMASDAAIVARRRRSVVGGDQPSTVAAALKQASKASAHARLGGLHGGSPSLIHMLRREAIAEDIDEVFEYEGGAAEIQFQNNQNNRGARAHKVGGGGHHRHTGNGTYYHAGTAGLNTVANYRRNKRKGIRVPGTVSSSSDDDREFSAARGYASKHTSKAVECTVDPKVLVAAMYVVAFAGSSDYGFELLIRADGKYPPYALLHKFIEITRYAVNPYVRGSALTCMSIICRSSLATNYLTSAYNCSVFNEASAYVTPSGIPYAVSFLQPHLAKWMVVGRPAMYASHHPCGCPVTSSTQHGPTTSTGHSRAHQGSSAYISQKNPPSTKNVPKDIQELVMMLLNPVSREKAKAPLAALMKDKPSMVVGNAVVRYMRECSCIYRMRHAERKFLADFFAKIRIVRYTHTREKQLQREFEREEEARKAQIQTQINANAAAFSGVGASGTYSTSSNAATGVPLSSVPQSASVNVPPMNTAGVREAAKGGGPGGAVLLDTPPPANLSVGPPPTVLEPQRPPRIISSDDI